MRVFVIPHGYPQRVNNLELILREAKESRLFDKMIVFFNYHSFPEIESHGALFIQSPHNFGSSIRYAIASGTGADTIFCQDDDILVPAESMKKIVDRVEREESVLAGVVGSIAGPMESPYRGRLHKNNSGQEKELSVDFILGRVTCFKKTLWSNYFALIQDLPHRLWNTHEDIPLSIANLRMDGENVLVGCDTKELPTGGVALEKQPQHYAVREELAKLCMTYLM